MKLAATAAAFFLSLASSALAQMPAWQNEATTRACSASFHERLADFRSGVVAQQRYMREYQSAMPWFYEHCRWLSEREIAVRRLDDAGSFVCDTRKGRPKTLTTEFALDHTEPRDIATFIEHSEVNRWCEPHDVLESISLRLAQFEPKHVEARIVLEVMCWRVESAKCDRARAALREANATASE